MKCCLEKKNKFYGNNENKVKLELVRIKLPETSVLPRLSADTVPIMMAVIESTHSSSNEPYVNLVEFCKVFSLVSAEKSVFFAGNELQHYPMMHIIPSLKASEL